MKSRTFTEDAYEMCRRTNSPGCVALAVKCMEFGYQLALKDTTEELAKMRKELNEFRERSNSPQ